jgi:hypothetical protein
VSKELLSGDRVDEARLLLQPSEAYEDAAIDLRLGVRATGLDVRTRRADLADGKQLGYDRLVLASHPRRPGDRAVPSVGVPHRIENDGGERLHIAWGFDRAELEDVGIIWDE